jgi:nucleotide-binding universal stress UspA family protein
MPILRAARHVQVVSVPGRTSGAVDFPGFNITRHFARHDVKCELKVAPTTMDVGNTLLSLAVDGSADLLVMGAYGHSRLRDLVLGGATQVVLQSMTLPVFMAH